MGGIVLVGRGNCPGGIVQGGKCPGGIVQGGMSGPRMSWFPRFRFMGAVEISSLRLRCSNVGAFLAKPPCSPCHFSCCSNYTHCFILWTTTNSTWLRSTEYGSVHPTPS